jgi:hypothetical protein
MIAGRQPRTGVLALVFVVACANDTRPVPPSVPAATTSAQERWPRFDELANSPALNERAFPTRGHLIKPSHAIVRVSPDARAEYAALVTDSVLPDGASIAMFHQSADGSEQGLVYAMEKVNRGWVFLVLDADGTVRSENVQGCALCHRGGVADHLFGLPRNVAGRSP